MAKASKGYKLDFAHQTITLTADFAEKANNPENAEYKLLRKFQRDFPTFEIVRRTHATPSRYRNSDGSTTTRNKHSGLTYERMEQFICALSPKDDTDYLEAFYEIRAKAEDMCASPYSVVSKWFMRQFPKFRSNPLFYIDNQPDIIDFSEALERAKKKPVQTKAEETA